MTSRGQTRGSLTEASQEGAGKIESIGGGPKELREVSAGGPTNNKTLTRDGGWFEGTVPIQERHADDSEDQGLNESSLVVALLEIAGRVKAQKVLPKPSEVSTKLTSRRTKIPRGRNQEPGEKVLISVDERRVDQLFDTAKVYFGGLENPEQREAVRRVLREAVAHCSIEHGMDEAAAWGAGFEWTKEALAADMEAFELAGRSIPVMAWNRQEALRPDRLNKERVMTLRKDNPERELLLQLCDGMRVHKPEGFTPNGATSTGTLHKSYKGSFPAVDKMLGANHEQGLGFVLPVSVMKGAEHHLMVSKWTTKKNTPSGRPIGDMSFGEGEHLNGEEAKVAASERYGAIKHPTIDEIVLAILEYWDEAKKEFPDLEWEELVLWKMTSKELTLC